MYPNEEVLQDLVELGTQFKIKDFLQKRFGTFEYLYDVSFDDDQEEVIDEHNFITKFVQKVFVDKYRRAIDLIKKGITLDGQADFTIFFSRSTIGKELCLYAPKRNVCNTILLYRF